MKGRIFRIHHPLMVNRSTSDGRVRPPPKPRSRWNAVLRCCLASALAVLPITLGAQRLPTGSPRGPSEVPRNARAVMPAVSHPGSQRDLAVRLRPICPGLPRDRSALLKAELQLDWVGDGRQPTSTDWSALACARAMLDADGAIAHDGVLMVSGSSWAQGAIAAAGEALRLDPKNAAAGEVFGLVGLDEMNPGGVRELLATVTTSLRAGAVSPALLRACDEFAFRVDSMAIARECTERGLTRGLDSTWHLVRKARERFRAADSVEGGRAFLEAVGAAHTDDAMDEVSWHVQWFFTPAELVAWEKVPAGMRRAWLHDRLAARDVRDGRPPGTRLAEHFERLDSVLANFTLHVAQVYRKNGMTGVQPENRISPESVAHFEEPGIVPAYALRFYHRWQQQIDDRGVVWMRFGAPKTRVVASPTYGKFYNIREVWAYEIDGNRMLLHFEGEDFDGSPGAARLVTRVLGTYLCGVDVRRCLLTMRSQSGGVNPETLESLRQQDQEALVIATTVDDNSVRTGKNIETVAQLHRLWDVATGSPVALVTYALKVGDLAVDGNQGQLASIGFDIRQHDPNADDTETSFTRRLVLPDSASKKSHLTGFAVVPSSPDVTAWSLVTTQSTDRRGRAFEDGRPPLGSAHLAISDLVLGAKSQDVRWDRDGQAVVLAPLGAMELKDAVHLYYQVKSDIPRAGTKTTIALTRTDQGPKALQNPAMQITFSADLRAGVSEVERQLDVTRLGGGSYRLDVVVAVRSGTVSVRQSAMLYLK